MSTQESGRSHEIYFNPASLESVNNSTKTNFKGKTLRTIAEEDPSLACSLLGRVIRDTPRLNIGYIGVQTEVGHVDSFNDGMFAARGDLLHTLEDSFAGGYAIQPLTLAIGALDGAVRGTGYPENKHVEFMINIEPPAMAGS